MRRIPRLLKRKKKPPSSIDPNKPVRDTLAPTVRTTTTIKQLRNSGLTDEEIEKLIGKKIRK